MAKSIKKQLENYILELKKEKVKCNKWNTEEMQSMEYVYEQVIEKLEKMISN